MSSEESFIRYLAEQMGDAGKIEYRKMFGEYAMYCDGKVVALVCDDRLYVKRTDAGKNFIGDAVEAPPYQGAKPCFLIEDKFEDREWIGELTRLTAKELPEAKPRHTTRKGRTKGR